MPISKEEALKTNAGLTFSAFCEFMYSNEYNSIWEPWAKSIHQDMKRPLTHYFQNSSHNTYLVGHQLKGESSVEMYREVLLKGVRCIELDCWDGKNDEPKITHGYTLVSDILFKDTV